MEELTALCGVVPLYPWILAVVKTSKRVLYYLKGFGLLANSDNLTRLNLERRNVYYVAINSDVLVTNELASCTTCRSDTKTVYYIVKAALEELKKNFTRYAFCLCCLLKHITELTLKHTIRVLCFLLLRQHDTIL